MRGKIAIAACVGFAVLASSGGAFADGFTENKPWAVRQPKGPADKGLAGDAPKQPAPTTTVSGGGTSASVAPNVAAQSVASAEAPPAAPNLIEEATPTTAQAKAADDPTFRLQGAGEESGLFGIQSLSDGGPILQNRWLWALLAALLLILAGIVEWRGRKRDEERAAEEPEDAPEPSAA